MGKLNKTEREWQRELSPEEFRITRQKGTEQAFTGKYWNTKQAGTYVCRCCGEPLFSSETNTIAVVVGQAFISRLNLLQ
jgi:Conserved domain frequently associated with peptide methionine sulfoxide reductase